MVMLSLSASWLSHGAEEREAGVGRLLRDGSVNYLNSCMRSERVETKDGADVEPTARR